MNHLFLKSLVKYAFFFFLTFMFISMVFLVKADEEEDDDDREDQKVEAIQTEPEPEQSKEEKTTTTSTSGDTKTEINTYIKNITKKDSDGDGILDENDPHPAVAEIFIVKDDNGNGVVDGFEK